MCEEECSILAASVIPRSEGGNVLISISSCRLPLLLMAAAMAAFVVAGRPRTSAGDDNMT
jgi:hypothetical protein